MEYKIDHIGYLTDSINDSLAVFTTLGYRGGDIVNDDTQRTYICFLYKNGETPIELVEPYKDNRTMQRMLSNRGNGPYHVCYCVDDINVSYEKFIADDWIPLSQPVSAPALDNRLICYFFKREFGYIELVNM